MSEKIPSLHERRRDNSANGYPCTQIQLDVAISGAGVAGLATAIALQQHNHRVTVYEAQPTTESIGYGIQIAPNSSRLLFRLGLEPYLRAHVTYPRHLMFRRWKNGKTLGIARLADFDDAYGSPYLQVNRAHLHEALLKRASDLGVVVRPRSRVVEYDLDRPSLTIEDGRKVTPDFVVVADGVRSVARSKWLNDGMCAREHTDFAAYRVAVDVGIIEKSPELSWLTRYPQQNAWIGPDHHVMAYPINDNKLLNVVTIAPLRPARTASESRAELMEELRDWDPVIRKLINLAPEVGKWPIWTAPHLPCMVSSSHNAVILGDAAHDMTPYLGQGAAMAVEDGVLLGHVLSSLQSREDMTHALDIFQTARISRTEIVRALSVRTRDRWHLQDGLDQEERDKDAEGELSGGKVKQSLCVLTDPICQHWLYKYDPEAPA